MRRGRSQAPGLVGQVKEFETYPRSSIKLSLDQEVKESCDQMWVLRLCDDAWRMQCGRCVGDRKSAFAI